MTILSSPTASSAAPHPVSHVALIPAAGVGARLGATIPKQYMLLAGKPMLLHALDTFAANPAISHTFVVVSAEDDYIEGLLSTQSHLQDKVTILRHGGASRQETVRNGLLHIRQHLRDNDWVLVHDAARPGLSQLLLNRLLTALQDDEVGGLLALPVVDTLKHSVNDRSSKTVPRAHLWAAQTPQMFRYGLLTQAMQQASERLSEITDDASAIEMLGLQPKLVEGSPRNFKVTLAHDVALAELFLQGS